MRCTTIESIEGNWRMDLEGDTSLVAAVFKIGKAKNFLVCEARLTGEQVLQLLSETRDPHILDDEIIADHHYILTAFDD